MKKLGFSVIDWIVLGVFILLCGIDTFCSFMIDIIQAITFTTKLNNPFDLVKFIEDQVFVIDGAPWLSKLFLLLVSAIPSILLSLLFRGVKLPTWLNYLISILLYWIVLFLFSSYVFWIIIGVIILSLFVFWLVRVIKEKKKIKTIHKT